jgi:poly-gamma-glutamate synthesis protein (capsule biosynthesis protein)
VGFGDVMLGRFVRNLMDANGLDYPFKKMSAEYLKSNDILLANLEGPIAQKAVKTTKAIAFRFMPDTAALLKKYYFDVLDLANNHMYDMGTQGYKDTKNALAEQGIAYFGDTKGIDSDSATKVEIRGQKIAFFGLEEVTNKIDDAKAVEEISQLTGEGYKVIPVVHWGVEYTHKPNDRQKELAHKFIDAGAIMVIGHHPHVVQAFEDYKGHPIFYSLGNAVFDQYFSADTQEGLSIGAIINDDSIGIFLFPLKIVNSQMILMNQEQRKSFLERFVTYGDYEDKIKNELLAGRLQMDFQQKKAE